MSRGPPPRQPTNEERPAEEKSEKREVNYSPGHASSHCGKVFDDDTGSCRHFLGSMHSYTSSGACEKVRGPIERTYWCEKFAARGIKR